MKIVVISDIHSNLQALEAVLKEIEQLKPDKIYCCGDLVGYGGNPNEVVSLIRKWNIPCVMGNHDLSLFDQKVKSKMNESAQLSVKITRRKLSDENLDFLSKLPLFITDKNIRIVHGVPPDSVLDYFLLNDDEIHDVFSRYKEKYCFVGHTHIFQAAIQSGGCVYRGLLPEQFAYGSRARLILNVGSVGQPRNGLCYAQFLMLDTRNRKIEVKRIEYDIGAAADAIVEAGMPFAFAERLWFGA